MLKMVAFDLGHTILDEELDREVELPVRPAFPIPGVLGALPQIRLPMGIWANTTAATAGDVRQWLNRAALDHFFSCIVTSTDVGYRKPDRRFFVHALATCRYRADEVLFVGTQLNSDIAGANECAIRSVFLTDRAYRSRDDAKVNTKPTYVHNSHRGAHHGAPGLVGNASQNSGLVGLREQGKTNCKYPNSYCQQLKSFPGICPSGSIYTHPQNERNVAGIFDFNSMFAQNHSAAAPLLPSSDHRAHRYRLGWQFR
jgi:hypothetical protein